MERKTRKPTQKRSIEKYEKILEAAFKLYNEKGYFNTTTLDIAKEAGVATGSIYSYFTDKKEIYIEIIKRINDNFFDPTHEYWEAQGPIVLKDEKGVKNLFEVFIKLMMKHHNFSKLFHDDLIAFGLLDEEIKNIRIENERWREQSTLEIFQKIQIPFKNEEASKVFMHYCDLLIDDVCHKILYDTALSNSDIYIDQTVAMLYQLLKNLSDM